MTSVPPPGEILISFRCRRPGGVQESGCRVTGFGPLRVARHDFRLKPCPDTCGGLKPNVTYFVHFCLANLSGDNIFHHPILLADRCEVWSAWATWIGQ